MMNAKKNNDLFISKMLHFSMVFGRALARRALFWCAE